MSDNRRNGGPGHNYKPGFGSSDEASYYMQDGPGDTPPGDSLSEVLREWNTPKPSPSLDTRVIFTYRREMERSGSASANPGSDPVSLPQRYDKEVVHMKECPVCHEQFADKFAFCPVDGNTLSAVKPLQTPRAEMPQARASAPITRELTENGNYAAHEGQHGVESTATKSEPSVEHAGARISEPHPASAAIFSTAVTEERNGDGAHAPDQAPAAQAGAAPAYSAFEAPAHSKTPSPAREEYHLTIIEDAGLIRRLRSELGEVAHASELTWPEFKKDPAGFTRRLILAYGAYFRRAFRQPHVMTAIASAVVIVFTVVLSIIALELYREKHPRESVRDDLTLIGMTTDIPEEQQKPDKGNAGVDQKGKGGGSKPKFEKPAGGGGGGREEQLPVSKGKLPQPSIEQPQVLAPNPKQPPIVNPHLPTPVTLDLDPKLAKFDPRNIPYGDPKSNASEISSGPGTGNGMGRGTGGGIGPGEGGGYGPGRGGNMGGGDRNIGGGGVGGNGGGDYSRVFSQKDVTRKVQILSKPEPSFTEEARKNNVTGEVWLKVIFTSSGQVSGIQPIKRLPDGLTEKAIEAVKRIEFIPAEKDGHKVSVYATIQYNFSIY